MFHIYSASVIHLAHCLFPVYEHAIIVQLYVSEAPSCNDTSNYLWGFHGGFWCKENKISQDYNP